MTAQTAMSETVPRFPPRATQRRSAIQIAAMIPAMMHNAYARIGIGPRSQTARLGLGNDASSTRRV
jgi:hypothetical protein